MAIRYLIVTSAIASLLNVDWLLAGDSSDQQRLIRPIIASWQTKKQDIKTIVCATRVETFYPKGSVSEQEKIPKQKELVPAEDQRFVDETCTWAIDFAAQRVKKEFQLTKPFGSDEGWELARDYRLQLFANGKFRSFRKTDNKFTGDAVKHDVDLHEERSHEFLLYILDLPILWLAGGVTGKWPLPTRMQLLDEPAAFSYRGEGEKNGFKCVILTTKEQKSKSAVREFWVGSQPPYPIHFCQARDGTNVYWELSVDYREQGGRQVPTKWNAIAHRKQKLSSTTTFTVRQLDFNEPLAERLFEKQIDPGMIVHHTRKNEFFEVDISGNLVPLGSVGRSSFWFWLATALVLAIVAVLGRRLLGKRQKLR